MEYFITRPLLDKLANMINFDKLSSDKVPETFNFKNKIYVPVGSISSGALGYTSVSCHEIVPLEKYNGTVEPKYNKEHHDLVQSGKYERGYHAKLLKLGSQKFVMINPRIYFKPIKEEKQLELWKI